jgi:hypothetical protein
MCLNAIRPVLIPDATLTKMLTFGRILLIINVLVSFLRLFTNNQGEMLMDLICSIFLLLAVFSAYFIYMALYVIFALFNSFYLLVTVAIYVQVIIMRNKVENVAALSISIFLLVFYIFAIIFTFPMYKEMKAQLTNAQSGRARNDEENGNNQPSQAANQVSQESSSGFRAFGGRGVAVGGG